VVAGCAQAEPPGAYRHSNIRTDMSQRTFLITGATKGIGRALSERLAAAGHHVVGIARNADDATFPGTLVAVDLSDRVATEEALQSLTGRFRFDGVVNNVGYVRLARIGEVDLDDLEYSFRLNLTPAVQTVQALLPGMRARGWGRVLNLSSLVVLGVTDRTAYAAAKAAMISFTRTWALELATTGITVNAVAPGPTETELFRQNTPAGSDAEQRFLSLVPMKRFGKPDELAAACDFLLSEDAGFITGQTLFVDGGASIGKASI
jgi:NAD(P)-dependent dehydrogenase (short-subunit alcohol dehydrogenase family)